MLLTFIASACSAQTQSRSQSTIRLEPLGEVVIPYNYSFKDTPVGGLSGLTYNPATEKFYVVSDDRSELAAARAYSFNVQLNDKGKLDRDGLQMQEVIFLRTLGGELYKLGTVDPEGIAVGSDSVIYIASEGGRNNEEPPFINGYHRDGTFARAFKMPAAYWASGKEKRETQGVRTNLSFESLTLSPDGATLYAGTENALMQDGPAADSVSDSPSRIIEYDVASGDVMNEYRYDVGKVFTSSDERGPFAVNGLSDLMALNNNGRLLSLDRNYVEGQGNHILLYDFTTAGATDIREIPAMTQHDQSIQPVKKKLVADLSDYGISIDNFEGLTLGPELPDGGRLFLIVSDNNFSDAQQTIFTAFCLHE
jgi:hypothetical protein